MCNACKINGMGKNKKNRIGGVSKTAVTEAVVTLATVPVGVIAAQEAKTFLIPMLYKDTDTAAQKDSKNMWGNVATGAVGIGLGVAGVMLKESEPEIGSGLLGFGAGMLGQCLLVPWIQKVRSDASGTPAKLNSSKWNAKAWADAKQRAMENKSRVTGLDNAAPGVMGTDNASPGVFGVLNIPAKTRMEEIGRRNRIGTRRQVGTCSL